MFEIVRYPREFDGQVWIHRPQSRLHPVHHHDDLEFKLTTHGRARCVVGGRRYDLVPGDLLWLFPEQEHQLIDLSPDYACWILVVRQRALRRLRHDPVYSPLTARDPAGSWLRRPAKADNAELVRLCADLIGAPAVRVNPGVGYAVLRAWDVFAANTATVATTLHPAVASACTALAQDPASGLEAIARKAGLSLSRLEHLFRAQLDTTLTAHRAGLRIERFQQFARARPQRTLLSLALDAGFGSYPQFHRMFVRHVGLTPAAWVRAAAATSPGR